ncbi:hypothetical protein NQ315_003834 [Exocentrus adspersus]|uniref:TLC domain-containing protein n=1 Tax=Exocentrus adspersus TaxID=1586481 RepID=A0AAV8VZD2_9CUCU|nr:hypothetical protein NQ315_003834 [Exocentrus adspersus]
MEEDSPPDTILTPIVTTKEYSFNFESLFAVVISVAVWRSAYTVIRLLLPNKSAEYCCRIITFIHGLLVAFIGINQCFLIDSPFDHPDWVTTHTQSLVMLASLGYFIHDLEWCIRYQTEEKLMMAHHVYSVFAIFRMLVKGTSGAQATCALGSMEITNPFLQLRWFIRSEGLYPSVLFNAVETTFMIVFVAIRIVLGTYYMVIIVKQPKNDWDFVLLSFTIYIMSWLFLINIVKYLLVKYCGFDKKKMRDLHNKGS